MWPRFAIHGGVSQPSPTYEPRMSSQGVVYQVVRHHFESFRAQAAGLRDGEGLPDSSSRPPRAQRFGEPRRSLGGGGSSPRFWG